MRLDSSNHLEGDQHNTAGALHFPICNLFGWIDQINWVKHERHSFIWDSTQFPISLIEFIHQQEGHWILLTRFLLMFCLMESLKNLIGVSDQINAAEALYSLIWDSVSFQISLSGLNLSVPRWMMDNPVVGCALFTIQDIYQMHLWTLHCHKPSTLKLLSALNESLQLSHKSTLSNVYSAMYNVQCNLISHLYR